MAGRPSPDEVFAYIDETGCTQVAAAEHFDMPVGTIRRWIHERRHSLGLKPAPKRKVKPRAPKPSASRARATPAAELPPSDREEAVRIVRATRKLTLRAVEAIAARLDDEGLSVEDINALLNRDAAQALYSYERTARDVLESHPDLLKLVGDDAAKGPDDERARQVAKALGVMPPAD